MVAEGAKLAGMPGAGADLLGMMVEGGGITWRPGSDLLGILGSEEDILGIPGAGADVLGRTIRGADIAGTPEARADLLGMMVEGAGITWLPGAGADMPGRPGKGAYLLGMPRAGADVLGRMGDGADIPGWHRTDVFWMPVEGENIPGISFLGQLSCFLSFFSALGLSATYSSLSIIFKALAFLLVLSLKVLLVCILLLTSSHFTIFVVVLTCSSIVRPKKSSPSMSTLSFKFTLNCSGLS